MKVSSFKGLALKSVKRIVVLQKDWSGGVQPQVVYRDRRRGARNLRPFEKAIRKLNVAQGTAAGVYLEAHERSNRKKRNGWFKDLRKNLARAGRKGGKKLFRGR